jgi:hypothetical protein
MPEMTRGSGEYREFFVQMFDLGASKLPLAHLPRVIEERKNILAGKRSSWAARIALSTTQDQRTPIQFFAYNGEPKDENDTRWNPEGAAHYAAFITKLELEANPPAPKQGGTDSEKENDKPGADPGDSDVATADPGMQNSSAETDPERPRDSA